MDTHREDKLFPPPLTAAKKGQAWWSRSSGVSDIQPGERASTEVTCGQEPKNLQHFQETQARYCGEPFPIRYQSTAVPAGWRFILSSFFFFPCSCSSVLPELPWTSLWVIIIGSCVLYCFTKVVILTLTLLLKNLIRPCYVVMCCPDWVMETLLWGVHVCAVFKCLAALIILKHIHVLFCYP